MAGVSFDRMDGHIWFDGKFVKWEDAKVHVLNHGLHYASSVFEGERAYGGEIFKLEKHTERFFKSAEYLGFEIPYSQDAINQACIDTLEKQGLVEGYLRPVAWRGSEMMAISAQKNTIHVAIAAWNWPSYFNPEEKLKGIRLDLSDWRRPDEKTIPSHAKAAGLYMICTLSKHAAEAKGFTDSLMLDYRGLIAEATGANVFFVKEGVLHTPTPDCFLNGLTRQTVIELAKRRNIEVVERHIELDELESFSECFLTGSAAEVTPVSEIAGRMFAPSEITKTLMEDYESEVRGRPAIKVS
ncbi:MAG: branched-chain amino acid aminotransferase [Hyphomicrobiales bacterium]|nr:branched-chain amino acid aminotransferase [Hyphomicrobiales bacterium]PCH51610.1 MAG: branched-chain amino acid aminotransferase [Hyphomicrobiales bacterium]